MDTEHEWLKVPEVADVLRIARSRAYELVGSGEIPSVRIGRSVRFSPEAAHGKRPAEFASASRHIVRVLRAFDLSETPEVLL